jgi:hypothetical protein
MFEQIYTKPIASNANVSDLYSKFSRLGNALSSVRSSVFSLSHSRQMTGQYPKVVHDHFPSQPLHFIIH